jgi:hypothetical protein
VALRAVLLKSAAEGLEKEIKDKNSFCTHVHEDSTDSEDERFCAKAKKRMPYDDIVRKAAQDVMYKKMFAKKQASDRQIPITKKPSNVHDLEKQMLDDLSDLLSDKDSLSSEEECKGANKARNNSVSSGSDFSL